VVLGRGQGSLAAATAAGGRPPSPATAYRPRRTCPENLPWQRHTTHLIEIKYCEDTCPEQQLQAAHAQHGHLRRSIAGDHVLHIILLGVGGAIYIPHTLVPLKSHSLYSQRVKKLALKLHAHSVHYAHKLVQTRRSLEHSPHLQTSQERSAGLPARNPPDPHRPPFPFLVKGIFFPSGLFSLIDVRSFLLLAKFFFSFFLLIFEVLQRFTERYLD